jgi:hypothetical protein
MASGLIEKHVGETLVIGFRYHSPAFGDDETLTGVSIGATSGIVVGTADVSGLEVSAPISSGVAGTDYTIRFTSSTSKGQVFIDDYIVKVIA